MTKTNKDIKGKLGKYDEKTKDMLKNLIKSNKNDFMKNLEDFKEGFEKELEKEKELLKEEYSREIKKYEKPEEKQINNSNEFKWIIKNYICDSALKKLNIKH